MELKVKGLRVDAEESVKFAKAMDEMELEYFIEYNLGEYGGKTVESYEEAKKAVEEFDSKNLSELLEGWNISISQEKGLIEIGEFNEYCEDSVGVYATLCDKKTAKQVATSIFKKAGY